MTAGNGCLSAVVAWVAGRSLSGDLTLDVQRSRHYGFLIIVMPNDFQAPRDKVEWLPRHPQCLLNRVDVRAVERDGFGVGIDIRVGE